MLLTFEKIREIQLNERSGELQKLPEGFFKDALEYLKLKADTEEGKTAQKILMIIFEKRLKKIVALSSIYYSTGRTPDNMEEEEQKIYSTFAATLKGSDSEFRKKLYNIKTLDLGKSGPKEVKTAEPRPQKETLNSEEEPPKSKVGISAAPEIGGESGVEGVGGGEANQQESEPTVNVKFLTDTPELMTPEMETCSFKKDQCVKIAKTFADFLEKRGFCTIERA